MLSLKGETPVQKGFLTISDLKKSVGQKLTLFFSDQQ